MSNIGIFWFLFVRSGQAAARRIRLFEATYIYSGAGLQFSRYVVLEVVRQVVVVRVIARVVRVAVAEATAFFKFPIFRRTIA